MDYSTLNKKKILTILAGYGFSDIEQYKILSGGSENTNYFVATKTNKFVLTICEQKTAHEATHLTQLLEDLAGAGFSTSKVIRDLKGLPTSHYNGKPVILKSFIEGKIISNLSGDLLELIGMEMGKLHKIKAPEYLPKNIGYGRERFKEVEAYAPNSTFNKWLREIDEYIEGHVSGDLLKALIHSDIFHSNVIVDEAEQCAIIMDFEEAAYYYRIFDIGMAIVGLCSKNEIVDLKKVGHLLQGYQREIKLTKAELKALQTFTVYAAASMSFWRHKNFNYVKPTPELTEHYMELKSIADYVKEISASDFYQTIQPR